MTVRGARALFDKVDVTEIVRRHYATLYDNRHGRPRVADYLVFLGLPLFVGSLPFWTATELGGSGDLLAAAAALGGLLFALLILLLQMASDTAARAETDGVDTRLLRRVKVLRELSGNVSYSVLCAIVVTVVLACGEFTLPSGIAATPGRPIPEVRQPKWFTCLVLFWVSHFVVTLLMVLKRTFAVTQRELDLASVPVGRG